MSRRRATLLVVASVALGLWLWSRAESPPGSPTVLAFVERLEPPELRWDLARDDPGYGERLAAGVRKHLGADVDLVAVSGPRFAMKSDPRVKYHQNLVGWRALPLVELTGARAVSVELGYVAADEGRIYWNLHWCDASGERLPGHSLEYLRVFVTGDKRKGPVTEVFEHIAVPCRAQTLRVEPAFAPMPMEITALRVHVHRARREPLASPSLDDAASIVQEFPVSAAGAAPDLAGRGIELIVPDCLDVAVLDRGDRPANLADGEPWYLHPLACHSILTRTTAGWDAWQLTGADSLTAVRRGRDLHVVAREYDFGERSLQVLPPDLEVGTARDHNLGVAASLPRGQLELHRHRGVDYFVFPTWQPDGRLATLVLSEHADLVNTDHQLAVLFGQPSEERREGLGIVGNHIPLSTTVWASDTLANVEVPIEGFLYRYSTLEGDPRLGEVYRRLRESGFPLEVGIHTAGPSFDPPARTRVGLERMRAFGSELWVDHSFFNNLESLVRSGWNRRGYDLPGMLREFGYRYAWAGSEKVLDELDLLRPQVAANAWFRVPRLEGGDAWALTLFSTVQTQLARIRPEQLEALQASRGLSFIHLYTALYSIDDRGCLRPEANAVLQELARRRDKGDLHLTTVAGFGAHHDLMRAVQLRPDAEGITIVGPEDLFARGATFGFVGLGSGRPATSSARARREGAATYFWGGTASAPGMFRVPVRVD